MTLSKEKKEELIKKYKIHSTDTGSPEVQISLLTDRINYLVEHLKANKKDHSSRRGLLLLVGKRKRLLNYLSRVDEKRHGKLIKDLGIR